MFVRYFGAFVFLLLVPVLAYAVHPLAALVAVILMPMVMTGARLSIPAWRDNRENARQIAYRLLPVAYAPVQVAVTAWAVWVSSSPHMSLLAFTGLMLADGIMAGVFGVLAAHELIHSHSGSENAMGLLMLTSMSYRHFRIAHIHGHHRHAATERDPTTARMGESFYAFWWRAVSGQLAITWQTEEARRKRASRSIFANRLVQDAVWMIALYAAIAFLLGTRGVLFFGLQSLVAITALELFNYVAHYGLVRQRGERFSDSHSWNASHAVENALLFNMGRHSDHHRHAAVPYQTLRPISDTPELPVGYAGSMLLALIPPLWRKLMDPRVLQLRPLPAE